MAIMCLRNDMRVLHLNNRANYWPKPTIATKVARGRDYDLDWSAERCICRAGLPASNLYGIFGMFESPREA